MVTALIVLKIIGWILLGLLTVIILALCVKVVISAEYSDEKTEVFAKWLFLKIPLYPAEKKPKKEKEKPPEEKKEEPEKPKEKSDVNLLKLLYESEGTDGLIEIVKRIFSYLGTFFGGLLRAFIVEELQLEVCCAKNDAAKTAIYYGEVCSVLFPMLGGLASGCTLKRYNVNVYPDFLARYGDASFYLRMHVVPIRLVGITLALVFKLIFKALLGPFVRMNGKKKKSSPQKPVKGGTVKTADSVNGAEAETEAAPPDTESVPADAAV